MAIETETIQEKELQKQIDRLFKLCDDYGDSCRQSLNLNRRMLYESKVNILYFMLLMVLWFGAGILLGMSL